MSFKEKVFEEAFGDNAINRGFSEADVIKRIREFSDTALLWEKHGEKAIEMLKKFSSAYGDSGQADDEIYCDIMSFISNDIPEDYSWTDDELECFDDEELEFLNSKTQKRALKLREGEF